MSGLRGAANADDVTSAVSGRVETHAKVLLLSVPGNITVPNVSKSVYHGVFV